MWLIVRATADEPDNRRCRRAREVDEARTIQAIYQGLERMEHRIESLETIVIDKAKTEKADEYAY
jgi:hypothetical protein